jgi:hypothetical protein
MVEFLCDGPEYLPNIAITNEQDLPVSRAMADIISFVLMQ